MSYNIYLYYTFFDKPQFFNAIQEEKVTGNEFFDWDKIKLPELEREKRKLKGEFLLSNIYSLCWNIIGIPLLLLVFFIAFGLFLLRIIKKPKDLASSWSKFLKNPKKYRLTLLLSLILYIFAWKYTLVIY